MLVGAVLSFSVRPYKSPLLDESFNRLDEELRLCWFCWFEAPVLLLVLFCVLAPDFGVSVCMARFIVLLPLLLLPLPPPPPASTSLTATY